MAGSVAEGPPVAETADVVCRALERSEEPLTASKLRCELTGPFRLSAEKLGALLDQLVAAGRLFRFAPYMSKSPRFWSRNAETYARREIVRELERTPLSIGVLQQRVARRLLDCPAAQRKSILDRLVRDGQIRQLPPVPGGRTPKYSAHPANPQDYVRAHVSDFVRRISQQASKLAAGDVAVAATWQAALRLLNEAIATAGVPVEGELSRRDAGAGSPGHLVQASPDRGVPLAPPAEAPPDAAAAALSALGTGPLGSASVLGRLVEFFRRRTDGGPVSMREVRQNCWPHADDKPQVDAALLDLARSGRVTLFRHDYPASLSESERHSLVADETGNFYNAILLQPRADA